MEARTRQVIEQRDVELGLYDDQAQPWCAIVVSWIARDYIMVCCAWFMVNDGSWGQEWFMVNDGRWGQCQYVRNIYIYIAVLVGYEWLMLLNDP